MSVFSSSLDGAVEQEEEYRIAADENHTFLSVKFEVSPHEDKRKSGAKQSCWDYQTVEEVCV